MRPTPSPLAASPDDAGDAGFSGQQGQHGVVGVRLLQAVLSALPRGPLAVEQRQRDVAVGVLVPQGGERRQGAPGRQVVLVAAVVVFLPHGGVVGVVEGRAQLGVGGGHGGGGGGGHGDGGDGLQLPEGALLADVQRRLVGEHGLGAAEGHLVLQLLPELGVELVALGAAPLDDGERLDGVLEGLHLLVVHDAAQLGTLDQDDFDLAGHEHVAQPRLQLEDAPAAPHHVVGRHDYDEALALVHAAGHVLDVGCGGGTWKHT